MYAARFERRKREIYMYINSRKQSNLYMSNFKMNYFHLTYAWFQGSKMANLCLTCVLISSFVIPCSECTKQEIWQGTCNIRAKTIPDIIKDFSIEKDSTHICDVCNIYLRNTSPEKINIASVKVCRYGYSRNINFTIQNTPCNNVHDAADFSIVCGKIRNKEKGIFESCREDNHCGKTTGATACIPLNGRKVCQCSKGYLFFKDRCIQRSVSLDSTCELTDQCRMRTNGSVCLDEGNSRKACQCDIGFRRNGNNCLLRGEQDDIEGATSLTVFPVTSKKIRDATMKFPNPTNLSKEQNDYTGIAASSADWVFILVASAGFCLGIICCTLAFLVIYKLKNRKNIYVPHMCAEECPVTNTTTQIYETSHNNPGLRENVAMNFKSSQEANPYSQAGNTSTEDGVYNHLRENTEAFLSDGFYDVSHSTSDCINWDSRNGDYDLAKNVYQTSL